MLRAQACVTALGSFTFAAFLLGGCGQSTPRTANDAVIKAATVAKETVPKVEEAPQLHIAARSGHHQMHVFPAFGRTFVAARGYIGEILNNGIVPRPELAKGLESAPGQPVGFYGDLKSEAYAVAISFGERSERYNVYKWSNNAWTLSNDHHGYATFFSSPSGATGTFVSHSDTPFLGMDQKALAGAPTIDGSRFASIASLSDSVLALEEPSYESDTKRAPRIAHWTKTGNRIYDLPLVGVSLANFRVVQMRAKGNRAMLLGTMGTSDNDVNAVQPYVATFDGSAWSRIDCPATMGEPNVGQLSPDGTLYLRTTKPKPGGNDVGSEHLWVRPVGGNWQSIDLPKSGSGGKCWYQDLEADESAVWLTASCDNDEGPQQVLFTSHPAYAKGRTPEKIDDPQAPSHAP